MGEGEPMYLVPPLLHTAARANKYHDDLAVCLSKRPTLPMGLKLARSSARAARTTKLKFNNYATFPLFRSYLNLNVSFTKHSSLMTWILLHRGLLTLRLLPACRTVRVPIDNQVVTLITDS
jgi:hypothetical protein